MGREGEGLQVGHPSGAAERSGLDVPVLRVRGGSMAPRLVSGDLVEIDADDRRARLGDLVVLRTGAGPVVHRVISTSPRRQMGDAELRPSRFDPADVVGRVVTIHRAGGTERLDGVRARVDALAATAGALVRLGMARGRTAHHARRAGRRPVLTAGEGQS